VRRARPGRQSITEGEARLREPKKESPMDKNTLSITDNRTGTHYTVPIFTGTYPKYGSAISAMALRQIKATPDDFGLMSHDPGFMNTAACRSAITFIDGDRGILRYRGYPIEQLAERRDFLETAFLIRHGELPGRPELEAWKREIAHYRLLHENTKKLMEGFHHDAHPMGMLVSTVAALSTFYPEARAIHDPVARGRQICRLVAKMPTIAAHAYRHGMGLPYNYPDEELSYTGNFLSMMFKRTEAKYTPNPVLEQALDVLFVLHADHEQNCSTNAARSVGSSQPDPYVVVASAASALYGPLHGGANEQVLRMLKEIGAKDRVPDYIKRVKAKEVRLMGFGHRVYRNYDPRAKIIKRIADEVFDVTGRNPLLEIALELERIALADDYFISHKLYPNVDFYSGIIYQAMRFPVEMFPVLFAIPRTIGWVAQWEEMLTDPEQKIARPQQIYTGADERRMAAGPAGETARSCAPDRQSRVIPAVELAGGK
jgi:citrate synthase